MIAGSIARRYAKALLEVGIAAKRTEEIGRELDAMAATYEGSLDLRKALTNPVVKGSQRRKIVDELATRHGVSAEVKRFLAILGERERVDALPLIARELRAMVDAQLGRVRATVTSAKPLSPDQEAKIRSAIEQQTGKKVLLERKEDPALIGGIVTQIGDLIIDGSVKSQLEQMQETILKEEQHFA